MTEPPGNDKNSSQILDSSLNKTISPQKLEDKPNKMNIFQWSPEIGFLFGSKSFIQLLVNPLMGPITDRCVYGHELVLKDQRAVQELFE